MRDDRAPDDLEELPPLLATIADAAGEEAALAIARVYGGTRVTTPVAAGRNWLTNLVGSSAAAEIVKALGGARRLDIPLGPTGGEYLASRRARALAFAELEARGASEAQIARALGVSGRTVRNRRAKRRANNERDLFD